MSKDQLVALESKDHIAVITLNNPPANAWGLAMGEAFKAILDQVEGDDEVRVVVITGGEAKCFSAGYDVTDAPNSAKTSPLVRELWRRLDRFEKPIICAMNGHALGGGLELALSCHFRVMTDNPKAMVGLTELNLGIIPGWGGTQRLARVVGRAKAMNMILFSQRLDSAKALEIGLVDRVVPAAELMNEVMAMAQTLAERPPIAVRWVLKSFAAGLYEGLDAGLNTEADGSMAVRDTEDRAEGFAAFLEKRKPEFKGR
ncbi:MAG: enoyl-CoA hydratase/isomerase family protein [Desulfarculaceae bacterium]|nr:enoyl-CoA hydratase/isomerase family protein [Desulfarculaceae bacterium]MCF8073139.1 enoyl-CoA hydratase/isomerase family protein [Desulfarculaceae bacterium]MCF8101776.1 enoyl-CoA hydratase/isomerase family protein [Desulfarculaceae bacterium]MCF8117340.1 enoyl-CoA hydratase/isomerase family protein [Desulfarculaceae bacterium]